ncbi:four-carbon acid sugar kinase family protein [Plastorhodobacter daqingensis]|uniref:Four-carbon acid sugar kinase family protein n=1 Tax=Plastorhodobacter daqingensis TaxID=1387281 RepID=A0ABW2UDW5_9RHOB
MTLPDGLLLAAYGDDFTGSAAVMEVMAFAGLHAALFLDLPTPQQLARFPKLRALIVAGTARSHGPEWMEAHLPRLFEGLSRTGAPLVHYKVCSTLDSAPHIGSIGRAVELALSVFAAPAVPVLLAAPAIRRYQCFGQLFAAAPGGVFRLDRHPVMACHPVTPMDEAEVARHLACQTTLPIGLIDLETMQDPQRTRTRLAELGAAGNRIICLDTLTDDDLALCGELLWDRRGPGAFCVGSQGVEYALVEHWRRSGLLAPAPHPPGIGRARGMIAVSGSVSSVTAAQIDWALAQGFQGLALEAGDLVGDDERSRAAEAAAMAACRAALSEGRDPLVHTARGPNDPAVARLAEARARAGIDAEVANTRIGAALGRILARVVQDTGLRRAVISGGDTSGHATRQLGIYALTALAPTIPGAAILRGWSEEPAFDGLELALKGGQMGGADYFGRIRDGGG